MAKMPKNPYTEEVREYMLLMYNSLTEKSQRHYAAIEAIKLGHGGIGYVSELFSVHRDTVSLGIEELKNNRMPPSDRIRRSGGGRKPKNVEDDKDTLAKFTQVVDAYKAGSPMNEKVQYTHLTAEELSDTLGREHSLHLSAYYILKLLARLCLRRRSLAKTGTARHVAGRNEQFENIKALIEQYREAGYAVYSVDAKKKEFLGTLYRHGKVYCDKALVCQDHDFPSLATGKVNPYGVYDLGRNCGYVYLNQSVDSSDYAADCIDHVLTHHHRSHYAQTSKVLILADSGGSNGANRHRFKEMLLSISKKHAVEIRVAHYPSYCSKYNPCDHRLFPHVSRAMKGVMLDSVETMRDLIKARAKTKTGLRVLVRQVKKTYRTGVKATKKFLRDNPVIHDMKLPKWNYVLNAIISPA